MDVVPIPPARDGRPPRPRAKREEPLMGLRIVRRSCGTAVAGPGFTVWDCDHRAAVGWAQQLMGGLSRRRQVGSTERSPESGDSCPAADSRPGTSVRCALPAPSCPLPLARLLLNLEPMQTFASGPGRGAECAASRNPRHLPERTAPERRAPQVLLAEDDGDFRALLAETLRRRGYEVTECVDGPDLVSKLGTYVLFGPPASFDLVVSDIRMPGATALEILEAMRECRGVPPVILITAFPSEDTHAAARQLGVAAVFEKPFELRDLVARVEELLAGRRPGDTT